MLYITKRFQVQKWKGKIYGFCLGNPLPHKIYLKSVRLSDFHLRKPTIFQWSRVKTLSPGGWNLNMPLQMWWVSTSGVCFPFPPLTTTMLYPPCSWIAHRHPQPRRHSCGKGRHIVPKLRAGYRSSHVGGPNTWPTPRTSDLVGKKNRSLQRGPPGGLRKPANVMNQRMVNWWIVVR